MIEQREEEASRIGRVLHDEIGQLVTAAGLQLDALRRELCPGENSTARLNEIQQIFEQVIDLVRGLSHSLPSGTVERTGLTFALDRLVGTFRERCRCTIRLMVDPHSRLTGRKAQAMYRIAECAIQNAVQHADATLIEVMLRPTSRGTELEIRDDGVGFRVPPPSESNAPGIGLLLMEHSASRSGLNLVVNSEPGAGTIIRILDASRIETI